MYYVKTQVSTYLQNTGRRTEKLRQFICQPAGMVRERNNVRSILTGVGTRNTKYDEKRIAGKKRTCALETKKKKKKNKSKNRET